MALSPIIREGQRYMFVVADQVMDQHVTGTVSAIIDQPNLAYHINQIDGLDPGAIQIIYDADVRRAKHLKEDGTIRWSIRIPAGGRRRSHRRRTHRRRSHRRRRL